MSRITALHLTIAYIVVLVAILFILRRRMKNKDYMLDLFLLGAFGWIIAFFFESVSLQFLTDFALYKIGIDLEDPELLVETYANLLFLLLGPLLIGVSEELARYQTFRLYKSIDKFMFKYRFKTSLFIGMGWASAEILLLSSFALLEGADYDINLYSTLLGFYVRLVSYVFHISLSFIVFFAVYEKSAKSRSLGLAIVFNIMLNAIFSIWIIFFQNLAKEQPIVYIISQQLMIGVVVLSILVFTLKYWIPHSEPILETSEIIDTNHNHHTNKNSFY